MIVRLQNFSILVLPHRVEQLDLDQPDKYHVHGRFRTSHHIAAFIAEQAKSHVDGFWIS